MDIQQVKKDFDNDVIVCRATILAVVDEALRLQKVVDGVRRPPIDTAEFRKLVSEYANHLMHGNIPDTGEAFGALVLHIEEWGDDSQPTEKVTQ